MPTPPVTVPSGQSVIWISATSAVPFVGNPLFGSASATLTAGLITQFNAGPLANSNEHIVWSGFVIPNILTNPGIVVHGIYAVFDAAVVDQHTVTGLNLAGNTISGAPWNGAGGNITQQWYSLMGTNPSLITSATITTAMDQTAPLGPFPADSINITYTGLAVYIDTPSVPSVFVSVSNNSSTDVGFN